MPANGENLDGATAEVRAKELDARAGKDSVCLAPEDQDGLPDPVERLGPHPRVVRRDQVFEKSAYRRSGEVAPEIARYQPREPGGPRVEAGPPLPGARRPPAARPHAARPPLSRQTGAGRGGAR